MHPVIVRCLKIFQTLPQTVRDWKWSMVGSIVMTYTATRLINRWYVSKYGKSPPIYFYDLPVVGSLFTMILWQKEFRLTILPKYGDIVCYHIGSTKYYKLNDSIVVDKVFTKAYQRPPVFAAIKEFGGMEPDVSTVNEARQWEERRKLIMHSLTVILNKSQVEENINRVLKEITYEYLDSKLCNININSGGSGTGYEWFPRECSRNASFNVIYLALFNKICKLESELFQQYSDTAILWADNIMAALTSLGLPDIIRSKLFQDNIDAFKKASGGLIKFIERDYQNYMRSIQNDTGDGGDGGGGSSGSINKIDNFNGCSTLVECYIQSQGDDDNKEWFKLRKERIVADLLASLQAGLDTTSHTMEVGLLLLAKYPKIQNIIYQELRNVLMKTNSKHFSLSHVFECPQFRAFVHEALRIACSIPDGVARTSDKDIRCLKYKPINNDKNKSTFEVICDYADSDVWDSDEILKILNNNGNKIKNVEYDYIIEKNSMIEGNLGYCCLNKKTWNLDNNAMIVNLNYWLHKSKNGKLKFTHNNHSIPFSAGKRQCPGQSLVVKELCAFYANLIIKYVISAPKNDPNNINIQYSFGELGFRVKPQLPVMVKIRECYAE